MDTKNIGTKHPKHKKNHDVMAKQGTSDDTWKNDTVSDTHQ
jgi:hypothetical protein